MPNTSVRDALDDIPWAQKSILTLEPDDRSGPRPIFVLSWEPIPDFDDTETYVGAWNVDAAEPDRLRLVETWRPATPDDVRLIVEDSYGPLGLDPKRVLEPAPTVDPTCGACAGREYWLGFDLDIARSGFCSPHRAHALALHALASSKAEANQSGWLAWDIALAMFHNSHVPYPIRRAFESLPEEFSGEALLVHARALADLVEYARAPDVLDDCLEDLEWDADEFHDWAVNLVYRLDLAGYRREAGTLVDLLAEPYPTGAADRRAQHAVFLAEDGAADEALRQLKLALDEPDRTPLTDMLAGEVHEHAGNDAEAEAWYERAREHALDSDLPLDYEHEALFFLEALAERQGGRDADVAGFRARRAELAAALRSQRPQHPARRGERVGRNDPCPCGSGQKYKRCHGI